MSLQFFTFGKPDVRMVEYSHDIFLLGEEKAQLNNETEKLKREIKQINIAYDIVRGVFLKNWEKLTEEEKKDVKEKAETLISFDEQMEQCKRVMEKLEEKKKKIDSLISEKENAVKILDDKFSMTKSRVAVVENLLQTAEVVREVREEEKRKTTNELVGAQRRLNVVQSKIQTISLENNTIEEAVEKKKKELEELNDIVSILNASNKNGLDMVASFEGERKRLLEKEEMLLRKERDLGIYEKRLTQQYKEIGKDITMIFR